ncbi:MAG TPA: hypothetical protein VIQ05_14515 [Tardiphaga sp.]
MIPTAQRTLPAYPTLARCFGDGLAGDTIAASDSERIGLMANARKRKVKADRLAREAAVLEGDARD